MNSNPTSVLLIDDNTVFLDSIARQLRRAGYEVASAPLPRAALEVLKMQTFDMIVCDLRMPDMTGLELQKHAREINPETGFVIDLKLLKQIILTEVIDQLDHKNINLDGKLLGLMGILILDMLYMFMP